MTFTDFIDCYGKMVDVDYLWTNEEITSFELSNRFEDTYLTFIIISSDEQVYQKLTDFMKPWIKHYPWIHSPPTFEQLQHKYKNKHKKSITINYIYGELNYHEYYDQSNLFIHILQLFTTKTKNVYIHCFDSVEIQPLLVLCQEIVDDEISNASASQNRVWLHDGNIIMLNSHQDDSFLH